MVAEGAGEEEVLSCLLGPLAFRASHLAFHRGRACRTGHLGEGFHNQIQPISSSTADDFYFFPAPPSLLNFFHPLSVLAFLATAFHSNHTFAMAFIYLDFPQTHFLREEDKDEGKASD